MQSDNPASHENAPNQSARETHFPAAHDKQANKGREKTGQVRQECCRPIVLHRNWQAKGQHSGVMHRPGADSHRDGASNPPIQSSSVARCGYSFCQFNRAISAYHTDQNGKDYDPIIVMTDDNFARSHDLLLRLLKSKKLLSALLFRTAEISSPHTTTVFQIPSKREPKNFSLNLTSSIPIFVISA